MITISRALARRLRIAFSRGLGITARQPGPAIEFQSDNQELIVRVQNDQIAIEYREPGEHPQKQFAAPFELLRRCEGTKDEPLTLERGELIRANWTDAGIPQAAQFDAMEFGELPALPEHMASNPACLAEALRDATETADKEATRYALNHLRLRGSDGQIAATDGRQLLVQDGFEFPWDDELLIPANRLLTTSTLAGGKAAAILYSVMASAKANQAEPFAYVRDLLVQLSGKRPDDLSELLPDEWLKKHPQSRRPWSR